MQELGTPCKHLLNVPLSVCSMVPPEHLGDGMKDGHVCIHSRELLCTVSSLWWLFVWVVVFFFCSVAQFPLAR